MSNVHVKWFLLLGLPIFFTGCVTMMDLAEAPPKTIHDSRCEGDIHTFEVLQVLDNGLLAYAHRDEKYRWECQLVLLAVQTKGEIFFDEQKIHIKKEQCPVYVGTFKYTTKLGMEKTVAKVQIFDSPSNPAYVEWAQKHDKK